MGAGCYYYYDKYYGCKYIMLTTYLTLPLQVTQSSNILALPPLVLSSPIRLALPSDAVKRLTVSDRDLCEGSC